MTCCTLLEQDDTSTMETRPTLKTIAFMTGLGVTTVSKALKDAPDISKGTRERVKMIARQVGYRPNRAGVRLRTGKTNVISLILNTQEEVFGLTSHLINGISEHLRDTQYHLVVTPYSHQSDPLDPVRYVVETGSADGVILSRTQPNDPRVRYLQEHGMPFATHGRTRENGDHPFHDFDNAHFANAAVTELAKRGRSFIGLLAPPAQYTYRDHMVEGFERGVQECDLRSMIIPGVTVDSSLTEVRAAIAVLMQRQNRPDAIICGSGASAIATVAAVEQAGETVGGTIDIATKQSTEVLQWLRPEIILYGEDVRRAGRDLAIAVLGAITGEPVSRLQTLIGPSRLAAEPTASAPASRETGP
jgi:LacI family transcriptional regulator